MSTPPRFDFITIYAVMRGRRVVFASSDRSASVAMSDLIGSNKMITGALVLSATAAATRAPVAKAKPVAKKPGKAKPAKRAPAANVPPAHGMTTGEAAKAAGVSIQTIATAIKRGDLKASKPKSGGWASIAEPDFMAWSKKRAANASA